MGSSRVTYHDCEEGAAKPKPKSVIPEKPPKPPSLKSDPKVAIPFPEREKNAII